MTSCDHRDRLNLPWICLVHMWSANVKKLKKLQHLTKPRSTINGVLACWASERQLYGRIDSSAKQGDRADTIFAGGSVMKRRRQWYSGEHSSARHLLYPSTGHFPNSRLQASLAALWAHFRSAMRPGAQCKSWMARRHSAARQRASWHVIVRRLGDSGPAGATPSASACTAKKKSR